MVYTAPTKFKIKNTTNLMNLFFESGGLKVAALHYEGREKCVVMAHGFGAVKESLIPYAERFSEDFGVLLFDYRFFGESEGWPRQLIDINTQLEDWRNAVEYAKYLGYEKIALWGTSFSGGHVLTIASEVDVDAVVSQVPFVDGLAVARAAGVKNVLRLTFSGMVDKLLSFIGRVNYVPIFAPEGGFAFMSSREAEKYRYIIPEGVEWFNAVPARIALSIVRYRPVERVERIRCPVLYVVAERDGITPAEAALKAAEMTKNSEVLRVNGDHFDVYLSLFEFCVEREREFLLRSLD
ncbi:MAG: uncharacterized protein PWQ40_2169 [Archaeoglobus sp.]|uniref:Hydrolase of the alpha/beta superfamily n=3 Tax=Archaeoglobaceae TaxID=2232 RepID=A0A075WM27_ARCFL|nr:Hydrolase of the alpha/beta superfamily [Archaeoglobus fulgidus DSM 8774]KUJ92813.1 MAG: hypothetical protein XD40_2007 [Archaeoglobus fulgidus]KUK05525.1 MAG: hypothetical protein XD48_2243 [Archaeoglobus fulgidus]MDI3498800.1 uncharacterized protein [Archaeoglobus sp.]